MSTATVERSTYDKLRGPCEHLIKNIRQLPEKEIDKSAIPDMPGLNNTISFGMMHKESLNYSLKLTVSVYVWHINLTNRTQWHKEWGELYGSSCLRRDRKYSSLCGRRLSCDSARQDGVQQELQSSKCPLLMKEAILESTKSLFVSKTCRRPLDV